VVCSLILSWHPPGLNWITTCGMIFYMTGILKTDKTERRQRMSRDNSKKSTNNHKKEDGTFHSKHINHNPQAESARAVFGLKEDNSKR
jgi:hypothetical protein